MISENDYQKLCQTCDEILLSDKADNKILANTWLHILREHPFFLKNYDYLFEYTNSIKLAKRSILNLIRFVGISNIRILQSIFSSKLWHTAQDLKESDVLFVSHMTNKKLIGEDNDSYFHDLPNRLGKKNISATIALINHIKVSNDKQFMAWSRNSITRLVLDNTLTFLDELKIIFLQIRSVPKLKTIMSELKTPQIFRLTACLQMISPETINAVRISKQIALLVSKTKSKYLVITYEGHAWERLALHEARKVNPNIKCIGYQHAPLIKYQHASKRNLSSSYNPDAIFSSGRIGEQQFKDSRNLKDIHIKCLGSAHSRRYELKKDNIQNCCLVMPDGILSECLILFEFSLFCAKKMPKHKFIWRLHPLWSFKALKNKSKFFKTLPDNIILSDETIDFDLERSASVLYRGSTAVINAINAGLKPIYYKVHNEMSIDPIYQHNIGKSEVTSFSEFNDSVKSSLTQGEKLALINFAQNLYSPFDYSVLFDLFQETKV